MFKINSNTVYKKNYEDFLKGHPNQITQQLYLQKIESFETKLDLLKTVRLELEEKEMLEQIKNEEIKSIDEFQRKISHVEKLCNKYNLKQEEKNILEIS